MEKHGIPIEIVWMTPDREDGQLQAVAVAQAVRDRASAILISSSDPARTTGVINNAVERGVPVMTFDSDGRVEAVRLLRGGRREAGAGGDARVCGTDAQEGLRGDPGGQRGRP